VTLARGPVPLGGAPSGGAPVAGAAVATARPAPPWLALAGGTALALAANEVALTLGLADALSVAAASTRLAALAVGVGLARTRFVWLLWAALLGVTALFVLVAYTPFVERPALALLRADAEGPPADAVVVFSAAMTDAGHISDIALTRLVSGLEDARRLGIPSLAVSVQTRRVRDREISSEPDQARLTTLLGGGVQLHVVHDVTNTWNESVAFAALARSHGWTRVHAVTSPLHARRACLALEAAGLAVTCAPATSRDVALTPLGTSEARLRVTRAAIHEAVGLVVYRLRGWI
jgi:uncharacterized SAM-binding protein YcdF (DUF218 family)